MLATTSSKNMSPGLLPTALVLFPTRLFIGMGWLRAGAEKAREPGWFDGTGVDSFLADHDGVGFLGSGIEWLFGGTMAPATATVVYVLQVVVGFGILVGAGTSALLLVGIGMNLTFLLCGAPNPSAFYIVLQLGLLWGSAGALLGIDGRASPNWSPLLVANPSQAQRWTRGRLGWGHALLGLAITACSVPFISHIEPALLVDDAAVVAAVCGVLPAAFLFAGRLGSDQQHPAN